MNKRRLRLWICLLFVPLWVFPSHAQQSKSPTIENFAKAEAPVVLCIDGLGRRDTRKLRQALDFGLCESGRQRISFRADPEVGRRRRGYFP